MKSKNIKILMVILAVLATIGVTIAQNGKQWVVYEGKAGPGNGKHIVFVSGDEEYRS